MNRRYGATVTRSAEQGGESLPPGVSWQAAVPVALFLAVNRLAGLRWAVVAATLWSIKLVVERRRKGIPLGRFMPIVTAAVLIRGAIGAITGSETVYFGLGIATKYVVAAVLVGSVLVRKPLAERGAPFALALPAPAVVHPAFKSTMRSLTLLAALYYLVSASFDTWLFQRSSVEGFVLTRFLANWPLSAATIATAIGIAHTGLAKIPGLAPLSELVESRVAQLTPIEENPA